MQTLKISIVNIAMLIIVIKMVLVEVTVINLYVVYKVLVKEMEGPSPGVMEEIWAQLQKQEQYEEINIHSLQYILQ